MDFSKYLVDWIKLSPRYLFPLFLFTGFVLFAPHDLLMRFGLGNLLAEYRFYFGLAFLLTAALLLTAGLPAIYEAVMQGRRQRARLKNMRERLHHLAEPEKEILRPFIYGRTRSQNLNMADGRVGGLEAEGVIFPRATSAISRVGRTTSNRGRGSISVSVPNCWLWKTQTLLGIC